MRPSLLATFLFVSGVVLLATGQSGEPAKQPADPWAGTYVKYRRGPYGDVEQVKVTITKGADGYYLSKPYNGRRFTEVEKGVLSDGKGGLGSIVAGSATFADGVRVPILRAEFCYEQFILYNGWDAATRTEPKGK